MFPFVQYAFCCGDDIDRNAQWGDYSLGMVQWVKLGYCRHARGEMGGMWNVG